MTTCDEARTRLENVGEMRQSERDTLSGYEESLGELEQQHNELERRLSDASSLAVQHESERDQANSASEAAATAVKEAKKQYIYWKAQLERLNGGMETDYSGERNERALIVGRQEAASDAVDDAEEAAK